MGEVVTDVLDGVPYTKPLKDNRRARVRSTGRPPSQWFLKENILISNEEDYAVENTTGTTEEEVEIRKAVNEKPKLRPLSFKGTPSTEDVRNSSSLTVPPWLEELRKKKQSKLQRNSTESVNTDSGDSQEPKSKEKTTPTSSEDRKGEFPWISQVRKKKHSFVEEDPLKVINNRISTNTILVVDNSSSFLPTPIGTSPPNLNNQPPISSTEPPFDENVTYTLAPKEFKEKYEYDDTDQEITEVMSPVNLDRKLSVREIDQEMMKMNSRNSESDGECVFEEVSSITLVKPLTRSDSLNRHNLHEANETDLTVLQENADVKSRLIEIIEKLEKVVNKNTLENQNIKRELELITEENRQLKKSLEMLKFEISNLN